MLAMDKDNVSFDISPLHLLDSQTLSCLWSYSVGGWIFSTELGGFSQPSSGMYTPEEQK